MKLKPREKNLLALLLIVLIAVLPLTLYVVPVLRNASKPASAVPETTAALPPPMEGYDIQFMLEEACDGAGVSLRGLTVGTYAPAGASGALLRAEAQITLSGTFDGILSLADALSKQESIRVTGFSATAGDEAQAASMTAAFYARGE